jgi:hypothetical protein
VRLIASLPSIREVSLRGCSKVTGAGLEHLAKAPRAPRHRLHHRQVSGDRRLRESPARGPSRAGSAPLPGHSTLIGDPGSLRARSSGTNSVEKRKE